MKRVIEAAFGQININKLTTNAIINNIDMFSKMVLPGGLENI